MQIKKLKNHYLQLPKVTDVAKISQANLLQISLINTVS